MRKVKTIYRQFDRIIIIMINSLCKCTKSSLNYSNANLERRFKSINRVLIKLKKVSFTIRRIPFVKRPLAVSLLWSPGFPCRLYLHSTIRIQQFLLTFETSTDPVRSFSDIIHWLQILLLRNEFTIRWIKRHGDDDDGERTPRTLTMGLFCQVKPKKVVTAATVSRVAVEPRVE